MLKLGKKSRSQDRCMGVKNIKASILSCVHTENILKWEQKWRFFNAHAWYGQWARGRRHLEPLLQSSLPVWSNNCCGAGSNDGDDGGFYKISWKWWRIDLVKESQSTIWVYAQNTASKSLLPRPVDILHLIYWGACRDEVGRLELLLITRLML